jgi:hypothetical protein
MENTTPFSIVDLVRTFDINILQQHKDVKAPWYYDVRFDYNPHKIVVSLTAKHDALVEYYPNTYKSFTKKINKGEVLIEMYFTAYEYDYIQVLKKTDMADEHLRDLDQIVRGTKGCPPTTCDETFEEVFKSYGNKRLRGSSSFGDPSGCQGAE